MKIQKWQYGAKALIFLCCMITSSTILISTASAQNQTNDGYYDLQNCGPIYGVMWAVDSVANVPVGILGQEVSYRFIAEETANITELRFHVAVDKNNVGYSKGNGGNYRVSVYNDIGGIPDYTTELGYAIWNTPFASGFPAINFTAPASVQMGNTYHIVWKNLDPDYRNNYLSLDGPEVFGPTWNSPLLSQPCVDYADFAVLAYYEHTGAGWTLMPRRSFDHEIKYDNGEYQGRGYVHGGVTYAKDVGGTDQVRENITVSNGDVTIMDVNVRANQCGTTPSGDLVAMLKTGAGTTLDACKITPESVFVGCPLHTFCYDAGTTNHHIKNADYATCTWPNGPHTLTNGENYYVSFSAPTKGDYCIFATQDGDGKGHNVDSHFEEGVAQASYNNGSTWTKGWPKTWENNIALSVAEDLQMFMRLESTESNPTSTPSAISTTAPSPVATSTPSPVATSTPSPVATSTPSPTMEPTMAPTNTPAPVFPSCDSADDSERTITGQIFVDENGNGQFDGTEQVFPNIIVILIDISSEWQTLTLTVTTDENGIYCFRNVPAAGYILSYAIPPGYITSGATNFTIDTSEGDVQAPNLGLTQEESLDVAIFLPLFTQNNVVK